MERQEVQAVFQRFGAPLMNFVALGADKEAAHDLARNLWMAMIAGEEAEKHVFAAMRDSSSELYDVLHRCYTEEMKPQVSDAVLAALRERYRMDEPQSE